MSLFTTMINALSTYLSPRKEPSRRAKSTKRGPLRSLSHDADNDTITVYSKNTKKRKVLDQSAQKSKKRRRLSPVDNSADLEDSTLLSSTRKVSQSKKGCVSPKEKADRQLMPPPSLKKHGRPSKKAASPQVSYPQLPDLEETENTAPREETPSRSTRVASSPVDLESMSSDLKARYEAAITLPENSGIWAKAEHALFHRLALRGFEPLLPPNWMIDFPTYPVSLFSSENSAPPLLQSLSGNDFRATQALKSVTEVGKRIRDRALASPGNSLRPEPIMSTTVNGYIDWALADAKMHPNQRPGALPVHVVSSLQKGQSTHEAIKDMTAELHDLAAQHRLEHGIRESVERDSTPASDATQVLEDDETLPILTGLLICSSLVVVVTLNAHSVPQTSFSSGETMTDAKDESELRFIATFDFSEAGMDVWNALAVAIVGMHVRNIMVQQYKFGVEAGEDREGGRWEFVDPKEAESDQIEDPDV